MFPQPKLAAECSNVPLKQTCSTATSTTPVEPVIEHIEEARRPSVEEASRVCLDDEAKRPLEEDEARKGDQSPSDYSDSGVSLKECLEVAVSLEADTPPPLKSPILSQPKTIRFPPRQKTVKGDAKHANNKSATSQNSGLCRWAECSLQFDTNGALLEHLQVSDRAVLLPEMRSVEGNNGA